MIDNELLLLVDQSSTPVTGAAALTGSGSMTVAGTAVISGAAALAGSGAMAAAGIVVRVGAAALTGSGSMTADGAHGRYVYVSAFPEAAKGRGENRPVVYQDATRGA